MAFYSQLDRMIQDDPINGVTVSKGKGPVSGADLAKKRAPRNKPVDGPVDTLEGPPMMSADALGAPVPAEMPMYPGMMAENFAGAPPMRPMPMPDPRVQQILDRYRQGGR